MNQFTKVDNLALFFASGSNYLPYSTSANSRLFYPLFLMAYVAAVLVPGSLACFHGGAKHILYILGMGGFPPQLSSQQAGWLWNVGTLM